MPRPFGEVVVVSHRGVRSNVEGIVKGMSSSSSQSNLLAYSCIGLGVASLVGAQLCNQSKVNKKTISVEKPFPKELKDELLSRVRSFFGEEGLQKINDSFVIVVGLGGVGSHCAHMIARSGVGKVRFIDFDQVTLSSLNRHAVATMADVGLSKAESTKKHLQEIVPWCEIEAVTEMFTMKEAERLLIGNPALVIDCIDDVQTKAELISYCYHHKLPIITSMGAGGKSDPTRLRISPITDCINDPLAQKIKWKLKKFQVPADEIISVFSIEKPVCELLPLDEEQKNAPQDFGTVDYLRLRIIPVLGTSPSIFGQALASYVLCKLGGKMYEPETSERMSKNLKHKIRQVFRNNEMQRFKTDKEINIDDDDVEFIVQQVWKSRCAISHKRFGGHIILTLTRWDATKPPTPYNLVLMMQNEAEKLAEKGWDAFAPEVVEKISHRLAWAKKACEDSWEDPKASEVVAYKTRSLPVAPQNSIFTAINNLSYLLLGLGVGGLLFQRLQRS